MKKQKIERLDERVLGFAGLGNSPRHGVLSPMDEKVDKIVSYLTKQYNEQKGIKEGDISPIPSPNALTSPSTFNVGESTDTGIQSKEEILTLLKDFNYKLGLAKEKQEPELKELLLQIQFKIADVWRFYGGYE